MIRFSGFAALFIAAATLSASAHAETPAVPMCRNGGLSEEDGPYGLAKIKGEGRALFLGDTAPCPSESAACKSYGYTLPGDLVIVGKTFGAYRCVFYRDQKNTGSAGYVLQDRIDALPPTNVTLKDWSGEWRSGDNYVKLRVRRDGKLSATGEAFWPEANPSPKERPGGPNLGGLSGTAAPKGNQVTFVDNENICRASLTLLPPFLLVDDNQGCGGANVTFRGVYMRPAAHEPSRRPH